MVNNPRYTLTVQDTRTGMESTIAASELAIFRSKTLSGKSQVYDLLDMFEKAVNGQASGHPSK